MIKTGWQKTLRHAPPQAAAKRLSSSTANQSQMEPFY